MEPKIGTIVAERGQYFLDVEGKREELPPADRSALDELRDQKVQVFYGAAPLVAITLADPKAINPRFRVVCYKPAPDLRASLGASVIVSDREIGQVLGALVKAGSITVETARLIAPEAKIG